ncbi:MAG: aldehyde dehydrogenase family protein [Acidobacteriia bacterium]|nr:aldehyde dehydrogenase family protein [Terriglobia bacterium]
MKAISKPTLSSWPDLTLRARRSRIAHLGKLIALRHREIAHAVTEETGRPITEVVNQELTGALEMLRFSAKMAPRWLRDERFRYWRPGFWAKSNTVRFEPLGVVLIIGPSNFPFSLPVMQACAALLCGNCVVIKPSERCPRTGSLIGELFVAARLPAGAVEVVEGGPDVAERLIARTDVQKVIFTGGCETGRKVAEACALYFKPCVLELGGGSSAIICADADLSLAARGIAWSAFYADGRSCVGTKRVFVHKSVSRMFLDLLTNEVAAINVGDPWDPATEVGTFSGGTAAARARELLRDAISKGARVWSPAGPLRDLDAAGFGAPFIVAAASPGMRVMQEEPQLPLVAVREVSGDEQALQEANQSAAGLGASVWSRNLNHARLTAQKIQAGMVWINDSSVGLPQFPWGGRKQSGWGRMFSRYGLIELTNIKVISAERQRLSRSKLWWFPYSRKKLDIFGTVNDLYSNSRRTKTLMRLVLALADLRRFARHPRKS